MQNLPEVKKFGANKVNTLKYRVFNAMRIKSQITFFNRKHMTIDSSKAGTHHPEKTKRQKDHLFFFALIKVSFNSKFQIKLKLSMLQINQVQTTLCLQKDLKQQAIKVKF